MASREELLQSINPGMKLDKAFFLKVYGYEISYPGFSDIAIKALEGAGCSQARNYYGKITTEYEKEYHKSIKEVSEWYQKECEKEWKKKQKGSDEQRRREEKDSLRLMSNGDLIALLESLTGAS